MEVGSEIIPTSLFFTAFLFEEILNNWININNEIFILTNEQNGNFSALMSLFNNKPDKYNQSSTKRKEGISVCRTIQYGWQGEW